MRPPAIRGALRALSHARTPSAGSASNAHAKAPRPHTPNASHTTQLSAHLCTHTYTCSAPHPREAVRAGNICRACTRLISHTRTHTSTPAAAQRRDRSRIVSSTQLRSCSMQQHTHHGGLHCTHVLGVTLARQFRSRRSFHNRQQRQLRSWRHSSTTRSAAQQ